MGNTLFNVAVTVATTLFYNILKTVSQSSLLACAVEKMEMMVSNYFCFPNQK